MPTSQKLKSHLPDFEKLASLQSFDPSLFKSENQDDQLVCNLILTLCIACNDVKDVMWSSSCLKKTSPQSCGKNRFRGQHAGFQYHVYKTLFSILFEIVETLKDRRSIFQHKLFQRAFAQLDKINKRRWEEIFKISEDTSVKHELIIKKFCSVRNRVAWHYKDNLKNYAQGFQRAFFDEKGAVKSRAYASLGRNVEGTRFYFADSCVEHLIMPPKDSDELKDFDKEIDRFLDDVLTGIISLIHAFIPLRGVALREEQEE